MRHQRRTLTLVASLWLAAPWLATPALPAEPDAPPPAEQAADQPASVAPGAPAAQAAPEAPAASEGPEADRNTVQLLGPLRIRDMTPFNLLRLDMLPAHAVEAGIGSWAIETNVSFANTFVMSDNVYAYLAARDRRAPLSLADTKAIFAMGQDAFYVDGEFGLLEVTGHYRVARRTSLYVTLSAYDFSGGFMDSPIEGFHNTFGFDPAGRDLVANHQFQAVVSLQGVRTVELAAPFNVGLGDPVLGVRHAIPLGASRWGLVTSAEAKIAWRGQQPFLSTGSNDYGVQLSLQGKFHKQAVYFSTSFVSTDGQDFGVTLARRVVPTLTAAYERGLNNRTSLILQGYASESVARETSADFIQADKFEGSLGVRTLRGRMIYGLAITENIANLMNTPDVGLSLTAAWTDLHR
jgi:hypothetical protein